MPNQQKGVGPLYSDQPLADHLDPKLVAEGDYRNVIDKYRYHSVESIKADLDKNAHQLEIAIENFKHDINIGTIVRNANAFGVRKVHIIGKKHWNRRGAMRCEAYMEVVYHQSTTMFLKTISQTILISIDNVKKSVPLQKAYLPLKAIFVFGNESDGVSKQLLKASAEIIHIEQRGSTRSINVGVASGIVLYKWLEVNVL